MVGPGVIGLSYEDLAWITSALVVGSAAALGRSLLIIFALLYSIGAHVIMTLNDFKAIEGDRQLGIPSLPVTMGVDRAAYLACAMMLVPPLLVALLLLNGGMPLRLYWRC